MLSGPADPRRVKQSAQRFRERRIGDRRVGRPFAAEEEQTRPDVPGTNEELVNQSGLSGSRLAFDHDQRPATRIERPQSREQQRDLSFAADEGGAGPRPSAYSLLGRSAPETRGELGYRRRRGTLHLLPVSPLVL